MKENDEKIRECFEQVKCRYAREVKWLLEHGFTEKTDFNLGTMEWESSMTKEGFSLIVQPPSEGWEVNGWRCSVSFGNMMLWECDGRGDDPEDAISISLVLLRRMAAEIIDGLVLSIEKEGK